MNPYLPQIVTLAIGLFAGLGIGRLFWRGKPEPEEDYDEIERCPVLVARDVVERFECSGAEKYREERDFRCDLDEHHRGPHHHHWDGDDYWWEDEAPSDHELFAIYDKSSGELNGTARRPHAEAMARLGHDVRRVVFDRNEAEKLEAKE